MAVEATAMSATTAQQPQHSRKRDVSSKLESCSARLYQQGLSAPFTVLEAASQAGLICDLMTVAVVRASTSWMVPWKRFHSVNLQRQTVSMPRAASAH